MYGTPLGNLRSYSVAANESRLNVRSVSGDFDTDFDTDFDIAFLITFAVVLVVVLYSVLVIHLQLTSTSTYAPYTQLHFAQDPLHGLN